METDDAGDADDPDKSLELAMGESNALMDELFNADKWRAFEGHPDQDRMYRAADYHDTV